MRRVKILGFHILSSEAHVADGVFSGCELWTLNDWWRFFPHLRRPHRLYQIHENWDGENSSMPWRNAPDWKARYEKSGADCVLANSEGLTRERIFDVDRADREFGRGFLGSTLSYMIVDAIWEGVAKVDLVGVKMLGDQEHIKQVPNLLWNVEVARARGIKVFNPYENVWKRMFDALGVRWEDLKEVSLRYGAKAKDKIEMVINKIEIESLVEITN